MGEDYDLIFTTNSDADAWEIYFWRLQKNMKNKFLIGYVT
jgi:hypothetical protein